MGLFSFTQEVAIDLGTANTIITCNDKMVVDEPSVIALDARSDKVLAVGKVAREMYEKTHRIFVLYDRFVRELSRIFTLPSK